ncbi:MAG: TonB-dependent receptor plug domain-containing protein [Bacteroidetes bacterium]|nr:TonB-dependent receptor plug domain-containing protein [Bacteroidota bacterium]
MDTTIILKAFSVEANRYTQNNPGQKSEKLDSSTIHAPIAQNLSDLLVQSNSFFVKSYGMGSLSTASFRGSSGSQTATLWNGFNLQSPMNGFLDYALIPACFLDEVSLSYGGASALYGSASVGGTILLNNLPKFNTGLHAAVSGSFGSFDNYQQSASVKWSNAKFSFSATAFNHTALNNYPFINTAELDKPKQFQQNAKLKQSGTLLESYLKLNQKQVLSIRFWYQSNQRQIPATIISGATKQIQKDEFYRVNMEWSYRAKQNQSKIRVAYFDERLNFNDPDIPLYSYSRSHTIITEAEDSYFFTEGLYLTLGVNNTFIKALSDGYSTLKPQQNRTAAFAALQINSKNKSWKNKVSVRKEYYGTHQVPFTASFGTEKLFFKLLKVRGNISRNYRLPTFNDLFWTEALAKGNANLKPESGWSGDVGIGQSYAKKKGNINSEISIFASEVKNMIVWQPGVNAIWSPQNVNSVWSRGLEARLDASYMISKILLQLNTKYSHTISKNNERNQTNAATFGKQLFYVPISIFQVEGMVSLKGFKISYLHNYTGKRFTNSENTEYLKSFKIGTITLSKTVTFKKIKFDIYSQFVNIWNEQYQIIAWRPMPLANYVVGLSVRI